MSGGWAVGYAQFRLLLRASRQRAAGRMRASAARRKRGGIASYGWSIFVNALLQVGIAACFLWIAHLADTAAVEGRGRLVVSEKTTGAIERAIAFQSETALSDLDGTLDLEAGARAHALGGTPDQSRRLLIDQYRAKGASGFVSDDQVTSPTDLTWRVLALVLAIWWLSLVLQGEGMNLDGMQRRHPMWEWYLGLPMHQGVAFAAEACAPALVNPGLLTAPIGFAVMVGWLHGSFLWGIAALPIAVPLVASATLWAKALEVIVILRSPVRNRGGWFALLSAMGTFALMAPLLLLQLRSAAWALAQAAAQRLANTPGARLLLDAGDAEGWLRAMMLSLAIGIALCIPAFLLLRVATARGLETGFGGAGGAVKAMSFGTKRKGWLRFLDEPLLRKEWLWLKRDRGALIQLFGLPLLMLVTQFANLHNLLQGAGASWNKLAGVVLFLATMLLASAAPRALLSEGPGLMLTLSWPRSLEDSLRVKVRVLFALVSVMVLASFGVIAWMFPADAISLFGVFALWCVLGLAVAEKSITMLRTPDSSGQIEPYPPGRIQPARIGNLTLALAVFTAQWQLAVVAIVMNWVFAAALWQKFRIHIAYLFDPDCEPDLKPPTVLSGVLGIVGLVELGSILAIPFVAGWGRDAAPYAQVIGYAIAAVIVAFIIKGWNERRGLYLVDTIVLAIEVHAWRWRPVLAGAGIGAALAIVGVGYQHLLAVLPWPPLQDVLARGAKALAEQPGLRVAYAIAAVGVAPWIEEYLFRGLLFRAMTSEWGLRRAVFASSAFFAILHPWTAWPMVFALGVACSLLFARSRSLVPCMVLHATYNALLLYLTF